MKKYSNAVGEDYIDRIILYIQKNRMQTFYNLLLLSIIMIQTPFMIAGLDSVTVEVDLPPKGTIIVQNNTANKLYYEVWAEHFSNNKEYYYTVEGKDEKVQFPYTASLVDFDYTNVEQKYSAFLKKYKPSKLLKDKNVYVSFIKNIKVKMISQTFDVEQIVATPQGDGEKATVTISGVAHQSAANTIIGDKACQYEIGFERIGGKLYATSLNTNCF